MRPTLLIMFLILSLLLAGCYPPQKQLKMNLPIILEQNESDMKYGYISNGRTVLDPWVDDVGRRDVVAELMEMARKGTPYPHAVLWMIKAYGTNVEFIEATRLLPGIDINKLPSTDTR